jgi:hypothetical protein
MRQRDDPAEIGQYRIFWASNLRLTSTARIGCSGGKLIASRLNTHTPLKPH